MRMTSEVRRASAVPLDRNRSTKQGVSTKRTLAGKELGETRTDALLSQPETGKISCVHHLPCARLSPGDGAIRSKFASGSILLPGKEFARRPTYSG